MTIKTRAWLPFVVASVAGTAFAAAPPVVTVSGDGDAKHPTIASDAKGNLHLAYESTDAGAAAPDVLYVSSGDGGKTWTKPQNLSGSPGASMDPAIAAGKDGSVAAVWTDVSAASPTPDIYFARSADGGKTWGKAVDISNTPGSSSAPDVKIAGNGTIYVIWLDTSAGADSPDVWGATSHDGGKTWDKAVDISNTPGKSMTPSIAVAADNSASVVWTDTTGGAASPDVYFSHSADGKAWSAAVDVSNTPGVSAECDVATDDKNNIYVVWTDAEAGKSPDIMVASSKDGGKTWSKPVDASNTPGVSSDPAIIATGNGKVGAVWVDTSEGDASPDVWMAGSSDGGKSWKKPANISNTPGISREPDVTIARGKAFVVWEEAEGGKSKVKLLGIALP